jgi:hypothetical protein
MSAHVVWITRGVPSLPESFGGDLAREGVNAAVDKGAMRVVFGPLGTELRWSLDAPCLASMIAAAELLRGWPEPYLFRYEVGAWAEERLVSASDAVKRLAQLMAFGDRPMLRSAIFKEASFADPIRTPILARIQRLGSAQPDQAVECLFDDDEGAFTVVRIGQNSMIGRIFGTDPYSYPCKAGGPYGRAIGQSYLRASTHQIMIYEQVLALLPMPDQIRRWVPYHRLIVPEKRANGTRLIRVYSEIASVDISAV